MWLQIIAVFNTFKELCDVAVIKWHCGSEHGVEDHTQTPHITLRSLVRPSKDYFRGSIKRASHTAGKMGLRRDFL